MTINFKSLGLRKKNRLIVGVSGGSDSIALLHLLKRAGCKHLIVAHLDHRIRKEGKNDALFVKKLCRQWHILYKSVRKNIPLIARRRKENLEAVAREQRYFFLRSVKKKYNADFIVTAHNLNDLIETVLMNMIRGCGLDGLIGIKQIEDDLIRPLLFISKKQIYKYCRSHRLNYVHDRTNDDPRYTRNFLRHEIIPLIAKLNPGFVETFANNVRLWSEATYYFEEKAKGFLQEHYMPPRSFSLKSFSALSRIEQETVLRSLFQEVHGHKKNLSFNHVDQILKILNTNISGKQKEFGPRHYIIKEKNRISVCKNLS